MYLLRYAVYALFLICFLFFLNYQVLYTLRKPRNTCYSSVKQKRQAIPKGGRKRGECSVWANNKEKKKVIQSLKRFFRLDQCYVEANKRADCQLACFETWYMLLSGIVCILVSLCPINMNELVVQSVDVGADRDRDDNERVGTRSRILYFFEPITRLGSMLCYSE
jgi:hypothetical protein